MYGLIDRFKTHPGNRCAPAAAMLADVGPLPGSLSFVVAEDPTDPDAVRITGVSTDQASHAASLAHLGVKASIATALPLIADFSLMIETGPVGSIGLSAVSQ